MIMICASKTSLQGLYVVALAQQDVTLYELPASVKFPYRGSSGLDKFQDNRLVSRKETKVWSQIWKLEFAGISASWLNEAGAVKITSPWSYWNPEYIDSQMSHVSSVQLVEMSGSWLFWIIWGISELVTTAWYSWAENRRNTVELYLLCQYDWILESFITYTKWRGRELSPRPHHKTLFLTLTNFRFLQLGIPISTQFFAACAPSTSARVGECKHCIV